MSFDDSDLTGGDSVLTGAQGADGGGGTPAQQTWWTLEAAAQAQDVPMLNVAVPVVPGLSQVGEAFGTNMGDANVEGGGVKGLGNPGYGFFSQATVWQNPKTSMYGLSFQAKLGTITAGKASCVGMSNAGGSASVVICTDQATSATDFVAYGFNGAKTSIVDLGPADGLVHTFRFTSDGVTVRFYLDGTLKGTLVTASEANFPTLPCAPGIYGSPAIAGMAIYKCVYSLVGPL